VLLRLLLAVLMVLASAMVLGVFWVVNFVETSFSVVCVMGNVGLVFELEVGLALWGVMFVGLVIVSGTRWIVVVGMVVVVAVVVGAYSWR